ncbi:dCTP deaminase [Svornostia abyssi]|uniref:dCTP deaminase n=1 Tax=Svornostia abyssi TaxID=2898438 RepID=UPI00338E9E1E
MARPLADRLVVTPLLAEDQIGPASVDVRLGSEFLLLRRTRGPGLDPGKHDQASVEDLQERVVVPLGDKLWLHPQHFVLAATFEYVRLPTDLGAYVVARSSWGRLGLVVATAILVQPGFAGCLTLELVNEGDSPIALYPGLRVAQLAFHTLETASPQPYHADGKYRAPTRPQASRVAAEAAHVDHLERLKALLASRLG